MKNFYKEVDEGIERQKIAKDMNNSQHIDDKKIMGERVQFRLRNIDENNGYMKFFLCQIDELNPVLINLVHEARSYLAGGRVNWHSFTKLI